MPLQITTNELRQGMKLHQPLYGGGLLVIPAGHVLNSVDVDLARRHSSGAMVSIEDPVLDGLVTFEDDTDDRAGAYRTQHRLLELLSDVEECFCARMRAKPMNCASIRSAISGVLRYLTQNRVSAQDLLDPACGQNCLVSHAAHVFYLALVMGNTMATHIAEATGGTRDPRSQSQVGELELAPLALAALFMDVGMYPLRDLFDQTESLTVEQCEQVRNHPVASAEALPEDAPELVKLIIETHHENYDGSGYPHGLVGEEIHIFARVLRLADAFAAATADRGYRRAVSPVRALWEMTWGSFTHFYDPVLLKLFAGLVQPYPIGAKLKLSTGQYGVVTRYGSNSPFLPQIVIAFDEEGNRLRADELRGPFELHDHPDLQIVAFRDEDVCDLYSRDTRINPITSAECTTLQDSVHVAPTMPSAVRGASASSR